MTPEERNSVIAELAQIRFETITTPTHSAWEWDANTKRSHRSSDILHDVKVRFGADVSQEIFRAYRAKSDEMLVAAGWEVDPNRNTWRKKQVWY